MKKFLGILSFAFLIVNPSEAKNVSLPKDLAIGLKARVSSVSHKKNMDLKKLRQKKVIL